MPYETLHPLVFFWIAFYSDGTYLSQFDMKNWKENRFISIDQTKLVRFGLFPFDLPFASNVNRTAGQIIARAEGSLPHFVLKIQKDQHLIYIRRNKIHIFSYQHCDKCGYEWQWMRGHQEGEQTEVGLLIHSNHITQKWKEREYDIGVCPKCGSFNAIICLDCGSLINEIKSPESKEHHFECPKCKKEYPRYIRLMESQLRQLIYLLGYQIIIDDEEEKQIMYIEEDGTLELKRKT